MTTIDERLSIQIATTTQRLAQLKAKHILKEMRAAARQEANARRAQLRRRSKLGAAVIWAGCGDWAVPEIVGVLVDARDRMGASSTQRLGMRKRGEIWLAGQRIPAPAAAQTIH